MSSKFERRRNSSTSGWIGRMSLASEAVKALAVLGTRENLTAMTYCHAVPWLLSRHAGCARWLASDELGISSQSMGRRWCSQFLLGPHQTENSITGHASLQGDGICISPVSLEDAQTLPLLTHWELSPSVKTGWCLAGSSGRLHREGSLGLEDASFSLRFTGCH